MTGLLLSGPGLIGRKHLELIAGNPSCHLAAFVAPNAEWHHRLSAELGVQRFSSVADALDTVPIDAAIISSPNEFHYEQTVACIEHGIPALVEKPLTDTLENSRALVEASAASKVPILVGHHRTYSPLLAAANAFLQSPEFGEMVTFQGSAQFYKPADYFQAGIWRTHKGGGPILINLIHEIGLMRHFCGEIDTVFAMDSRARRGFEVEDTVALCFRFKGGALGTFLLSDCAASHKSWEMTSGENPAYPSYPDASCYHFAGTNGSLDFPSMRARHYNMSQEGSWWVPFEELALNSQRFDPLERQLQHFLDVVTNGAQPLVGAEEGYRNMLVIEAIAQSIEHGVPVCPDTVIP